jgi:hypothetical protein
MRHSQLVRSYTPQLDSNQSSKAGWTCYTPINIRVAAGAAEIEPSRRADQVDRRQPAIAPNPTSEVKRLHRANICRSLTRRIEQARQQGNESLIELLESELAAL